MVHGHHAEQVVVELGDRLARPVAVDVARDEILQVTTKRAVVDRHEGTTCRGRVVKPNDCTRQRLAVNGEAPQAQVRVPTGWGRDSPRERHVRWAKPSGIPGGWLTVNSHRTETGCVPSGVSNITGRPSASSRKSSQWCAASASCQSTSIFRATADGDGIGPRSCSSRHPSDGRASRRTPGPHRTATSSPSRRGGYRSRKVAD